MASKPHAVGNPIINIQDRLQALRSERENCDADICDLELERHAIEETLAKVLQQLGEKRENISYSLRERMVLDRAIEEIESTYGHILFTPAFYGGDAFAEAADGQKQGAEQGLGTMPPPAERGGPRARETGPGGFAPEAVPQLVSDSRGRTGGSKRR